MKVHFTWPICSSYFFQSASKALILSSSGIDAYFTIFMQEKDRKFIDKELENMAEIVCYKNENNYQNPWDNMPKWDLKPKADIVLGLDADVLVTNKESLLKFIEDSFYQKAILGTIAYESAFKEHEWESIFQKYNLKENFNFVQGKDNEKCPYYINNGAILIPSSLLDEFKYYLRKWIKSPKYIIN